MTGAPRRSDAVWSARQNGYGAVPGEQTHGRPPHTFAQLRPFGNMARRVVATSRPSDRGASGAPDRWREETPKTSSACPVGRELHFSNQDTRHACDTAGQ